MIKPPADTIVNKTVSNKTNLKQIFILVSMAGENTSYLNLLLQDNALF